jgi:GNAT superfamily N-acetyltransferase
MKLKFRKISSYDVDYLELLYYETIFTLDDEAMPDRSILSQAKHQKYLRPWHKDDIGYIAIDSYTEEAVGAVWIRFFNQISPGDAYINDDLPELVVVVDGQFRGEGVGTDLVHYLMAHLPARVKGICLAVDVRNPALHFFEQLGFLAFRTDKTIAVLRYDRH